MTPETPASPPAQDRAGILQRVQVELARLLKLESPDAISESTTLAEDLGVDSLGMVDLVIVIEEAFQVKLSSDTDLSKVRTVSDMVDLLQDLIARRG